MDNLKSKIKNIFGCKYGFHTFHRYDESSRDCYRKCIKCDRVEYFYLTWFKFHNQGIDLSKFRYLGEE
jgi:hypothetical protein